MPTIPAADLERLAADIFAARDVPRDDAEWIATLLVRANLRGHDSHGVIRVPQYCAALKTGHLNPAPKIQFAVDTPTIAVLDGDHGFGQVVARRGTTLAIERGRVHGLAAVALRRTSHVGRLADYAEAMAAAGLVGMLWANAKSGLNVAPWGGSGKRLGTNPHAIAIPGPGGAVAMSHDFASSVWAEGKLRVKFNRGEKVPPGIMLNARGEPSTDPREFYGDPPGSLLTAGAHKGYGLSLAIEILGGILSGPGRARSRAPAAERQARDHRRGRASPRRVARGAPRADRRREVSLRRELGVLPLAAIVFFNVSGGPYGIEDTVPSFGPGLTLVLLVLTPLLWSLPVSLAMAELASAMPDEGGYVTWTTRAFGPFWGFQVGWWSWLDSFVDVAVYPALFVEYLRYWHPTMAPLERWLLAVVFIAVLTTLNLLGVRPTGHAAVALSAAALAPVALLVAVGLPRIATAPWTPFTLEGHTLAGGLGLGLAVVMLNYAGLDTPSTVLGETHAPGRAFPRAP